MKVKIEINCEDEKDIMVHLSVIRQQIRQALKQNPGKARHELQDENCYGGHTVMIELEK
ncbi:hypothetical protein [Foetidibacter luteolus]|uniref:hypothetical protein n=1 Tax=Foetidibacter luteolus TaxID=2608880 RepID=UPI00129ACCBC|nr:hypothetical protein [Foetidibacter luteolus]